MLHSRPSRWKAVHNTRQPISSPSKSQSSSYTTALDTNFLFPNDGTMITDGELYRIAIVLGCAAMVLIVLHHFLETNAEDLAESDALHDKKSAKVAAAPSKAK
ncbi:Oligosaccaryltransferase-domain-containing protein [Sordaria brevicollis]|uniref:Dolichyl-diphosphooligosaccharide--protein glycosyltransferase subunit 4 n=1 Tax=Sordaria brevicollis TaxID=83679 RepID=A0AAE0PC95_SORBR|nr:Oligosaccaryltransferase-domain-containing protein [Sordaria brevicollis]